MTRIPVRIRSAAIVPTFALATLLGACGIAQDEAAGPSVGLLTVPHSTGAQSDREQAWTKLVPAEFAKRIASTKGPLINVHTPDEGEIPETDHHIAWNRIVGDSRLPANKATEILLYCRTGGMSAAAARSLVEAGYTRVVELDGGYTAWRAQGRPFHEARPAAR